MADEQTSDFFMSGPDDGAAFGAPDFAGDFDASDFASPGGGDDSQIGDVYYGSVPDAQTADFFNPPPVSDEADPPVAGDAPIILGDPGGYEAPSGNDGDAMGFAASAPHGAVEDVDDEEEEAAIAAAPTDLVLAEPTPMAKWNDEWQRTLLDRKEEENSIKASHVEKAWEEVAAFQAERERRREARMAKNRSDEQDKLEAIEADLENDNSWQRVVKMIELNQDGGEGAADTGRMKDVLVLLKNEPARAEALSA